MKVRTGASAQGRTIEVEVYPEDVPQWDDLTGTELFKKMSAFADFLVVSYMARETLIPSDYAKQRLTSLKKIIDD